MNFQFGHKWGLLITVDPPVNSVAPVVTGVGYNGQTMSTTNGTWTGDVDSYSYQWQANGIDIFGATSSTYTVTSTTEGTSITCQVIASNAGGSSDPANSNAIHNWIPSDATLRTWIDSSDTSTITATGDDVDQIDDKSENGYDFVSLGTPTTGTRSLNSLNVIDFNGGEGLESTSLQLPSNGNFVVVHLAVIDSVNDFLQSLHSWQAADDYQFQASEGDPTTEFDGRVNTTEATSFNLTGGPYSGPVVTVVVFDYSANTISARMDGTDRGSVNDYNSPVSQTGAYFSIFANRSQSERPNGAAADFVILDDVDSATIQKAEGYMAWKWDRVSQLDAGHTYKSAPPTAA